MADFSESGTYTAWDLAADWRWVDDRFEAVIGNGRIRWETATATKGSNGKTIRLERLDVSTGRPRAIARYVDPDTQMRLVPSGVGEFNA